MFKTNNIDLSDLLKRVDNGEIQLPDFQRDWVWNDEDIRDLLESVVRQYPIGAVLTLQRGGNLRFLNRPIEGASAEVATKPDEFLLDGQQRLTSLLQAIYSKDAVRAKVRRRKERRWYYIDLLKSIHGEGHFIVAASESKVVIASEADGHLLDLTNEEDEFKNHLMPTNLLLDAMEWQDKYRAYWEQSGCPSHVVNERLRRFNRAIVFPANRYEVPVITLDKGLPLKAVCAVFEKLNSTGIDLTNFELLTAKLAAEEFNLRESWAAQRKRLRKHRVLRSITGDHFLQAVAMLSNDNSGCDNADILGLDRSSYESCEESATRGFLEAAGFLNEMRIFGETELPYVHQAVTLAILFGGKPNDLRHANARSRLATWYWCGVFGGDYSRSVNSRVVEDCQQVIGYVRGDGRSARVDFATFDPIRLTEIRTRSNAAYRGISARLLLNDCRDWYTDREMDFAIYEDEQVDVHHIFPRAWCRDGSKNSLGQPIPNNICNSIINKAPLTAKTNRAIGGQAPSDYLVKLREGNERLDRRLPNYLVDVVTLEQDDFVTFYVERGNALISMIHEAMGKPAPGNARQVFREALKNAGLTP